MKTKKLLACLMAGTMMLSLAACGNEDASNNAESTSDVLESTPEATAEPTPEPTPEPEEASIDFEDGNMGFISLYTLPANADKSELSLVDYNGSTALQVKNVNGKIPYVAFDIASLLGADVEKVATIEATIGTTNDAGVFSATAGDILAWSGADLIESADAWSVYLEKANPKKVSAVLSEADGERFVADCNNIFMITLRDDPGAAEEVGYGNSTMYIDNIRFLDADGNLITVPDTTVAFAGPEAFAGGVDLSNLCALSGATEYADAVSGAGWAQTDLPSSTAILEALVPGTVIEISYESANGDMWIVAPDNTTVGWTRIGDGNNAAGFSYTNNSKSVAQITYEQIAAVLGEDKTTWGGRLQAEASGDYKVFGVKVGQKVPVYALANAVDFPDYATSAAGWAQAGFDMPQEFIDALVPGSVIEISYESANGDMWLIMNGATAGWIRCGDGSNESGTAVRYGGKAYITFEQMAAIYGEDVSTWGTSLQCEASGDWEVFSVRVGTAQVTPMVNQLVDFPDFATSAAGWAQAGFDMPQEVIDALVPGSVVEISYESANGDMWIIMNGAQAGWIRCGDGSNESGKSICSNGTCYITFEQMAAIYGEDVSTWGTSMQCEASGDWEVFAVKVGKVAQ